MPHLLQLRGQRTAACYGVFGIYSMNAVVEHRLRKPVPLDCRIPARKTRVQHLPVFNKQKSLHDERRNLAKIRVHARGTIECEQTVSAAIENIESRLIFVRIDR